MTSGALRFQFVDHAGRYAGETRAISCDGLVPGASLDLTHWQGNRTPVRFKADTSTEIALNFAASPESSEWIGAVVVNNHFDTDGILSAFALLEPDFALANPNLLIAAAEAGDFDEWPELDRGLKLDAAIRSLAARSHADAAAYAEILPGLKGLIEHLDDRRELWESDWNTLQAALQAFESGRLLVERAGRIGLCVHAKGEPESPGPLLARLFLPGSSRYLLAFVQDDERFSYRYERPRYAWADTVVRPPCPAPDAGTIAEALGPDWTADDLPGMTGIVQTLRPSSEPPDTLMVRLNAIDPA
jgi:hypothetical protein